MLFAVDALQNDLDERTREGQEGSGEWNYKKGRSRN